MSARAPRYPSPGEQRMTLAAFARALRREARTLAERPELLWQQMSNRLRWEGEGLREALTGELEQWRARPSGPWVRLAFPRRDVSSLVRTFAFGTQTPFGPWSSKVEACAISPDGRYVAAAGSGLGLVWEARTGQLAAELRTGNIHFCAFGPDSSWLLCAGAYDDQVQVTTWATADWHKRSFSAPRDDQSSMHAAALSYDGRILVTALNHMLFIWDVRAGRITRKRAEHHHIVHACAFSPDGTLFASGDEGSTLLIWDTSTWTVQREIAFRLGQMSASTVLACAISPDNRLVVAGGSGGMLRVFERTSSAEVRTLKHGGAVYACAISSDGSVLASAGDDRLIRLWDLQTGEQISELAGHEMRPRTCAFSRDGAQLVSGGDEARVLLWEAIPAAALPLGPPIHADDVQTCALSGDGSLALTVSRDGTAILWRLATGEVVSTTKTDGTTAESCAISPDGAYFLIATGDQGVYVWDAHTGQQKSRLRSDMQPAAQRGRAVCAVSPDGHWVLVATGQEIQRWDAGNWQLARSFGGPAAAIRACVITPDERWIVSGDQEGALRVWDAASGDLAHTLESSHGPIRTCAISPDAALLVAIHGGEEASSEDPPRQSAASHSIHTVAIWRTDSWAVERTLTWEAADAIACAFTPDARSVLVASADGAITVWELTSEQSREYQLPTRGVLCLAAHPYKLLMVGGEHGGEIVVAELMGSALGPIIVTAHDEEGHIAVKCPGCGRLIDIEPHQLGHAMDCHWPACGERMQVNLFVLQMAHLSASAEATAASVPAEEAVTPETAEPPAAAPAAADPALAVPEPAPGARDEGASADAQSSAPNGGVSTTSSEPAVAKVERRGLRRFLPGGRAQ